MATVIEFPERHLPTVDPEDMRALIRLAFTMGDILRNYSDEVIAAALEELPDIIHDRIKGHAGGVA